MAESEEGGGLLTPEEIDDNDKLIRSITVNLMRAEKIASQIGHRGLDGALSSLHSDLNAASEVLGINMEDPGGPVQQSGGGPKDPP